MKNNVFITYRHMRRDQNTSNEGGVTFAILVDLRDPEDRFMKVGYAMCHPDMDNFNKRQGRKLAYRRLSLVRKWESKIPYTSKEEGGTIMDQLLNYVATDDTFDDLNRYLRKHIWW